MMSPATSHRLKNVLRKLLCLHFKEGGLRLSIWLLRALYVNPLKTFNAKRGKNISASYTSVRVPLTFTVFTSSEEI